MTTKSTVRLRDLVQATEIPAGLVRAVVRQMGGWESFIESAPDICRGGIDGGFHGFIYYSDTNVFARRNRRDIAELASAQASEFGMGIFGMIRGFGCFRSGPAPTDQEIGLALYAGEEAENSVPVLNALAWYAGEEVARAYCRLTEQD